MEEDAPLDSRKIPLQELHAPTVTLKRLLLLLVALTDSRKMLVDVHLVSSEGW